MSEETQLVVAKPKGGFNVAMLSKVTGLSDNSPLRKMQGQGAMRLTVDGDQFQIKKGSKVVQTIMDLENPKRPAKELAVVIHQISPVIQKQAALKYDPRNPKFSPLGCWSNDGNSPDEDVWNKQSHKCDTCRFGMGKEILDKDSGEMASCSLTRMAVVSLYNPTEKPENIELLLMNFNWSSNSTKKPGPDLDENTFCLINYLTMLASIDGEGVETHRVVTNLVVDDWSHPKNNCKLMFSPIGTLSDGDPNYEAHKLWEEDDSKNLVELRTITQRKPAEDDLEGDGGAPDNEPEEEVEEVKKPASKKKASKKKASKKKAAKKKAEEVEEEEEEIDLDDLDSDDSDDSELDEEELVEEDDEDFGELDDLL